MSIRSLQHCFLKVLAVKAKLRTISSTSCVHSTVLRDIHLPPLCGLSPSGLAQKSPLMASCVLGLSRGRQSSRSKVVSCLNKPRGQGQTRGKGLDHLLRFCFLWEVCVVGMARSGCLPRCIALFSLGSRAQRPFRQCYAQRKRRPSPSALKGKGPRRKTSELCCRTAGQLSPEEDRDRCFTNIFPRFLLDFLFS